MKRRHELIVVNVAVAVPVKNVCNGAHLQTTGGEFCGRDVQCLKMSISLAVQL